MLSVMTTSHETPAGPLAEPESILRSYRAAVAPLTDVVAAVPDWSAPSPCAGWAAYDVLEHLVGTQRALLTDRGLSLPAAPDLAADPVAGWREHTDTVCRLLADPAVAGLAYEGFFGPTTLAQTMDRFYVFDMLVHRWDLARAAGADTRFTDGELDRIEASAESFGPMLYAEGICGPALTPAPGSDRQARVLAVLGRQAG